MRWMKQISFPLLAVLLFAGVSACDGDPPVAVTAEPAAAARIEGTVTYRERSILPPGAEVEIQLQDVSRADAMATIMASVILTPTGAPPYRFVIDYDPAAISPRGRYALRATIADGKRLLFSSTDYIDPFQDPPVEILVRRVPDAVTRDAPALEGPGWVLRTLGGEPAPVGAGGKRVDIRFDAEGQRASGFSGCNRYTGTYRREGAAAEGQALTFGPTAGTRMACAEGGELELAYLQMLAGVTSFRLQGDTLSLLSDGEVVATFGPS